MVCLRLKPRVAGWKAQTNPLSQGGTPVNCLFEKSFMIFFKNLILALQARKMFAQTSCPLYTSKVVTDPYLPTYLPTYLPRIIRNVRWGWAHLFAKFWPVRSSRTNWSKKWKETLSKVTVSTYLLRRSGPYYKQITVVEKDCSSIICLIKYDPRVLFYGQWLLY